MSIAKVTQFNKDSLIELCILSNIKHPNIVTIIDKKISSKIKIYLEMGLYTLGDLNESYVKNNIPI